MRKKAGKKDKDLSLNHNERGMIQGVRRLSELSAKDILVPRIDCVFISLDKPMKEVISDITRSGHSRFPVYRDTIDNVVGMLYVKDIFIRSAQLDVENINVEAIMRKPYFVPESKHIDSLMHDMRAFRVHIAVVVDEYGGVAGIVTLEDVIEEIVGEIRDEFDKEQDDIIRIRNNIYLCDARAPILELNNRFNLGIPNDDFDTLGGFVFDLFGKIPVRYEQQKFGNADFIIQEMHGNRIESIKIVLPTGDGDEG